jgi:hypothetical protein
MKSIDDTCTVQLQVVLIVRNGIFSQTGIQVPDTCTRCIYIFQDFYCQFHLTQFLQCIDFTWLTIQ